MAGPAVEVAWMSTVLTCASPAETARQAAMRETRATREVYIMRMRTILIRIIESDRRGVNDLGFRERGLWPPAPRAQCPRAAACPEPSVAPVPLAVPSELALHPPPSASIRATLATRRLWRMLRSVCASASAIVCAVITEV